MPCGNRRYNIAKVKEKLLAARRAKIKTVILPAPNRRDLEDMPKEVLEDLNFIFVENVLEVFRHILREKVVPIEKSKSRAAKQAR